MSEKNIALFFDDAELGSHLRAALCEHGARIAHEGPLSSFDESTLRHAGVDVLVVNLDDAVDDAALDRIYGLIESGDIPVVFNDAQASRALDGWDRARWARHLAAKALDGSSIDPPRPDHAREVAPPAVPDIPAQPHATVPQPEAEETVVEEPVAEEPVPEFVAATDDMTLEHAASSADSETLAAELEALLASDEGPGHVEDEFGTGLKYSEGDALPPLHDGHFGWRDDPPAPSHIALPAAESLEAAAPQAENSHAVAPAFNINLDHLSLTSLDEEITPPVLEKASLAQQTPGHSAPEWGFVEEDDLSSAKDASEAGSNFGIEKVSAADYLAPDAELPEGNEPPIEPGMSLELVSIEEAVAPRQAYEPYETHLHELDTAFARLLVLGAARDSHASLSAFLAALPDDIRLPVLLTQHQGSRTAEQLAESLAAHSALPLKVAAPGMRARLGEIVVVPRGQQVRITRDGKVELTAANEDANEQTPSIDSSFTMAANVFGRDALAIVFAGRATDAVAGAQAIHDRGGQVWVESSGNDQYSDMVNGVLAERLASFSGSPRELAGRLVEDFR
ncbi:chemotaxis protein CheB [Dyella jejuensis]|uniref:protein-glutamate methylesterase n=1 Tax=Dyella jejuensis TaxID=1432009 RepID=A0ABW8JHH6_9GAMM